MKPLRQLGFIRWHVAGTDTRADGQIGRACGRQPSCYSRQTDGVSCATTHMSSSSPLVFPTPPAHFIALLQVYPGNSQGQSALKTTTVKVTGNCGKVLVKRPVCLQLSSTPSFRHQTQETEPRGKAWCWLSLPALLSISATYEAASSSGSSHCFTFSSNI